MITGPLAHPVGDRPAYRRCKWPCPANHGFTCCSLSFVSAHRPPRPPMPSPRTHAADRFPFRVGLNRNELDQVLGLIAPGRATGEDAATSLSVPKNDR